MNKAISGSKLRYEILDGLFLHRLKLRTLIALAVIAALLVVNVCLNIDIFGVLDVRNYAAYTVIGGWSLTPDLLLLYHRD